METALMACMDLPSVRLWLQQRARGAGRAQGTSSASGSGDKDTKGLEKEIQSLKDKLRAKNVSDAFISPTMEGGKGTSAAAKKSKKEKGGKGDRARTVAMPRALIGGVPKITKDGVSKSICFDFNLGKCNACAPGEACPRGLHVCCMPGCHANHPRDGGHPN